MFGEKDRGELLFVVKAILTWIIWAFTLTLIFSFIISKTSFDSSYIAYISSVISFISAVFAGHKASICRRDSGINTGLFTAIFLIIFILTIGFVVKGESISSSGVISVVSFTFAGVIVGACGIAGLRYGNRKKISKKYKRGA